MGTPQLEEGYTRIANEILERIAQTSLTGSELRLLLVVLRVTYGFQKKSDPISITRFQHLTGLSRQGVMKGLASLERSNTLLRKGRKQLITIWEFNKDLSSWGRQPECARQPQGRQSECTKVDNQGVPELGNDGCPTKERKKTLKKKESPERLLHALWRDSTPGSPKTLPPLTQDKITSRLRRYSFEDCETVIRTYCRLRAEGRAPGYGKWSLVRLMTDSQYWDEMTDPAWEGFVDSKAKNAMSQEPKFF